MLDIHLEITMQSFRFVLYSTITYFQKLIGRKEAVIDVCMCVQLLSSTDSLLRCLEHPLAAVRHMAARCLAVYSRILTSDVMERVISRVVPLLGASDNVIHRQGAIEAISCILVQYAVR